MIVDGLLIIHSTGITFLNRLICWKNTPNLRTLTHFFFMLINIINCLLKLLPFILYTFRLNLAQYAVRCLSNNIRRFPNSLLIHRFLSNFLLLHHNNSLLLLWRLSHFTTLRSLRHSFFILPLFPDKTLQV